MVTTNELLDPDPVTVDNLKPVAKFATPATLSVFPNTTAPNTLRVDAILLAPPIESVDVVSIAPAELNMPCWITIAVDRALPTDSVTGAAWKVAPRTLRVELNTVAPRTDNVLPRTVSPLAESDASIEVAPPILTSPVVTVKAVLSAGTVIVAVSVYVDAPVTDRVLTVVRPETLSVDPNVVSPVKVVEPALLRIPC
jgi:hypothetical protein